MQPSPRAMSALGVAGCLAVAVALTLVWRPARSMPDAVRIPIVEPHPPGAPPDAARFLHGRHDQFSCSACHPALFPKWRAGFTHRDMNEGRFCGVCHDGSAAQAIASMECLSCHVPK